MNIIIVLWFFSFVGESLSNQPSHEDLLVTDDAESYVRTDDESYMRTDEEEVYEQEAKTRRNIHVRAGTQVTIEHNQ